MIERPTMLALLEIAPPLTFNPSSTHECIIERAGIPFRRLHALEATLPFVRGSRHEIRSLA